MQDAGIVTRILQKWTPEKKCCEPPDTTTWISLAQIRTAFYVLAIGVGLGLLTLAVEALAKRRGCTRSL